MENDTVLDGEMVVSYRTLPAAFSNTKLETIPVSTLSGMCELKPIPT
jgi:hypothetical protein